MSLEVNKPVQMAALGVILAAMVGFSLLQIEGQRTVEALDSSAKEEIKEQKSAKYQRAKPITEPQGFINADNVSIEENIGDKVILLDMWTYSCINCQRTLPHLREWNRKYSDDGLLIIGNHAPEFEFEEKRSNVKDAVERFNITYPVVLDNEFGTWDAYNNRYWPQKYLIGIDGFIRYEHIGEGAYNRTEEKIVRLLEERKERLGIDQPVDADGVREMDRDALDTTDIEPENVGSPEIYFGAWRNNRLSNAHQNTIGTFNLSEPESVDKNRLYLEGQWKIERKYAEGKENSSIIFRYDSKNVNMVLEGNDTTVKVIQDGKPVEESAGEPVQNSTFEVGEEKLYQVIQNQDYGQHKLELKVQEGKLKAYTFTFG